MTRRMGTTGRNADSATDSLHALFSLNSVRMITSLFLWVIPKIK